MVRFTGLLVAGIVFISGFSVEAGVQCGDEECEPGKFCYLCPLPTDPNNLLCLRAIMHGCVLYGAPPPTEKPYNPYEKFMGYSPAPEVPSYGYQPPPEVPSQRYPPSGGYYEPEPEVPSKRYPPSGGYYEPEPEVPSKRYPPSRDYYEPEPEVPSKRYPPASGYYKPEPSHRYRPGTGIHEAATERETWCEDECERGKECYHCPPDNYICLVEPFPKCVKAQEYHDSLRKKALPPSPYSCKFGAHEETCAPRVSCWAHYSTDSRRHMRKLTCSTQVPREAVTGYRWEVFVDRSSSSRY